jgi:RNA polymerase sigma factor (TIGR02999 family)
VKVFPLIYDELHRLAQQQLRREPDGHTLSPTALVQEAYMRLIDYTRLEWANRAHFMAVAATAMRRILVDHARGHRSVKRGGGVRPDWAGAKLWLQRYVGAEGG